MPEARCITSHEQPGEKPGRFKRYVAGEVYEISKLNRYFEPVKEGTLKKLAEEKKKTAEQRDVEKKRDDQKRQDAHKQAYDKRKAAEAKDEKGGKV